MVFNQLYLSKTKNILKKIDKEMVQIQHTIREKADYTP